MTFRVAHEWKRGALINGVRLSTCPHCHTLRSEGLDGTHYTVRSPNGAAERGDQVGGVVGHVRFDVPPCIPPVESTALQAARASAAADREREARKAAIAALGPDPVDPPEAPAPVRDCFFPWLSNVLVRRDG